MRRRFWCRSRGRLAKRALGVMDLIRPLYAAAFEFWGMPVSWLEIVAFVLAVAMVVCNMRVNPTAWPLAISSSLLYFLLFWDNRLYGDASLQLFFAAVALFAATGFALMLAPHTTLAVIGFVLSASLFEAVRRRRARAADGPAG